MTQRQQSDARFTRPLGLGRLNRRESHDFDETATAGECAAVARALDLPAVSKLRISGTLTPVTGGGWRARGQVGASVEQTCVVTLEPVRTRIDTPFDRLYLPDADPRGDEIVIDAESDEDVEPLPETLDLGEIAVEETALALPPYPRAKGARLDAAAAGDDEDAEARKPFAALAALRDKIRGDGE